MKSLILILSLLSFLSCTNKEKLDQTKESNRTQASSADTSAHANKAGSVIKPVIRNSFPAGTTKWTYEKRVDKEGVTVYKASITSPNLLEFKFPYAGGSTATLTARHKNGTSFLYLEVSRGQFNRSFQGGIARIQFDDKVARDYSFTAAENGRANIIFFDATQPLIDQLKKAQKLIIDIEFYAQGRRQIQFRTADLKWNH